MFTVVGVCLSKLEKWHTFLRLANISNLITVRVLLVMFVVDDLFPIITEKIEATPSFSAAAKLICAFGFRVYETRI